MTGYIKEDSLTTQLLVARSQTYKERVLEMIRNEKIAFKSLTGLTLTNKMMALVSGISESTIAHINKYPETACKKIRFVLKKANYYSRVSRTLKQAKKPR